MGRSDSSCPFIDGVGSTPSRRGPVQPKAARPGLRSPRFRRSPFVRDKVSDLGGASAPRLSVPHILPSTISKASASTISYLSRLNRSPHTIAVYASQRSSPSATQHSLPGGRYPLPGPDFHRLDHASFAWRTDIVMKWACQGAGLAGAEIFGGRSGGGRPVEWQVAGCGVPAGRPLSPTLSHKGRGSFLVSGAGAGAACGRGRLAVCSAAARGRVCVGCRGSGAVSSASVSSSGSASGAAWWPASRRCAASLPKASVRSRRQATSTSSSARYGDQLACASADCVICSSIASSGSSGERGGALFTSFSYHR